MKGVAGYPAKAVSGRVQGGCRARREPNTPTSDTFAQHGDAVLEAIVAGCTTRDAALQAGVSPRTVERWLQRGREDPDGPHGDFAVEVDFARSERELPAGLGDLDYPDLVGVVSEAARKGNVEAMRIRWRMLLAEEGER